MLWLKPFHIVLMVTWLAGTYWIKHWASCPIFPSLNAKQVRVGSRSLRSRAAIPGR